jgi:hypothetical protein
VLPTRSVKAGTHLIPPSTFALATFSILVLLAVLGIYGTFSFTALSPSGLEILNTPTGAMAIRNGIFSSHFVSSNITVKSGPGMMNKFPEGGEVLSEGVAPSFN